VPILNWISPSTIKDDHMDRQSNICALHVNSQNPERGIGIMMSPMHSYKSGSLWLLDHSCQKSLNQKNCTVDRTWGLAFKEKVDQRDQRPLLYHGRFVQPGSADKNKTIWAKSEFFGECITKAAIQVPTKEMRVVEDMDPNALPVTYDDGHGKFGIGAARKFMQIGEDAAGKMLTGMITNVEFGDKGGVLWLDLNPDVGDFAQAFFNQRGKAHVPTFYYATCRDDVHQEWLEKSLVEYYSREFTEERFTLPGVKPKSRTPPDDLLETPPPKPELNVLTWMPDLPEKRGHPGGVQIPADKVKAWYQHALYGDKFRTFYDLVSTSCITTMDSPGCQFKFLLELVLISKNKTLWNL